MSVLTANRKSSAIQIHVWSPVGLWWASQKGCRLRGVHLGPWPAVMLWGRAWWWMFLQQHSINRMISIWLFYLIADIRDAFTKNIAEEEVISCRRISNPCAHIQPNFVQNACTEMRWQRSLKHNVRNVVKMSAYEGNEILCMEGWSKVVSTVMITPRLPWFSLGNYFTYLEQNFVKWEVDVLFSWLSHSLRPPLKQSTDQFCIFSLTVASLHRAELV